MMRVLLADDEPLELLNLQALFQRAEGTYDLRMAENGYQAIDILEQEPVDIAFLDIRMPGMDGIEVLQTIAERWPDTEVAIVSAYGEFSYAQRALELGATAYLLKPFGTAEFYRILQKVTERHAERNVTKPLIQQSLLEKALFSPEPIDSDLLQSYYGFLPETVVVMQTSQVELEEQLRKNLTADMGVWAPEKIDSVSVFLAKKEKLAEVQQILLRSKLLHPDEAILYAIGESSDVRKAYKAALAQLRENNNTIVQHCLEFIQENYQQSLTLTEVASAVHVSPSHLNRLLKKELGCTFVDILSTTRIEKAKELLKKAYSIDYVADCTGFSSLAYFTVTFKKVTGQSPTSYRRGKS